MKTITENVVCIYNDLGILVALLKRDARSGKKIVYYAGEEDIDDIAMLIDPTHKQLV